MRKLVFGLAVAITVSIGATTMRADVTTWPQFRGADSRGVSENSGLPTEWSETKNIEWKKNLPGRGWSSPVVWDDRVFLTTVVNLGETEPLRKGLYFGGDRLKPPASTHQWKVICLDLKTGNTRWEKQVHEGIPESPIHIKSSYASETPVTDGEHVYFYFGHIGIFCFDLDGEEVWQKPIAKVNMRSGWGTAASPVLHKDRIYVVNDNEDQSYLLALDKETGDEIWKVVRDDEDSNWSTPFIWENGQRTEIVTPGTDRIRSYDLDGNLLWWLEGMSSITIATPYQDDGLLYVTSGYVGSPAKPIYAIKPGATDNITLAEDETSNDYIAWSQPKSAPYNPSTIVYRGQLYVLYDFGFIASFDARNGKEVHKKNRIRKGGGFTTSPWAYDGKLFCANEDGKTFVFDVSSGDLDVSHVNELADDDLCMASPAIVGDRLLIRTDTKIYCIRNAENRSAAN